MTNRRTISAISGVVLAALAAGATMTAAGTASAHDPEAWHHGGGYAKRQDWRENERRRAAWQREQERERERRHQAWLRAQREREWHQRHDHRHDHRNDGYRWGNAGWNNGGYGNNGWSGKGGNGWYGNNDGPRGTVDTGCPKRCKPGYGG